MMPGRKIRSVPHDGLTTGPSLVTIGLWAECGD